eukprot:CAMPEP_0181084320 /NCGR_PEP_ID=MMETSP1071-20121207/4630_1 /TAXON_ID=35127 /ORGANISM="Thalassiosira sp., Strain NH16" /LENGTH=140 /DNA_ID=CAMNT_0023166041 /DNA_START=384 /DNA_END=806 /DNA_ORIENTATION=-
MLITKVGGAFLTDARGLRCQHQSALAKRVETAGIPVLERDFSGESVVSAMIAQQLAMQDGAGRVNRCAARSHDGDRPCRTLVAEAPDLFAEARDHCVFLDEVMDDTVTEDGRNEGREFARARARRRRGEARRLRFVWHSK